MRLNCHLFYYYYYYDDDDGGGSNDYDDYDYSNNHY